MRYLVVSDTHGSLHGLYDAIDYIGHFDGLIHLGDVEGQDYEISRLLGTKAYIQLRGNCDLNYTLDQERIAGFGNHRVLMVHGHRHGVKSTYSVLKQRALEEKCDIVFYGHTHRADYYEEDGIILANPGSLSYPRGYESRPSFIIMEIDSNGDVDIEIEYLEEDY